MGVLCIFLQPSRMHTQVVLKFGIYERVWQSFGYDVCKDIEEKF